MGLNRLGCRGGVTEDGGEGTVGGRPEADELTPESICGPEAVDNSKPVQVVATETGDGDGGGWRHFGGFFTFFFLPAHPISWARLPQPVRPYVHLSSIQLSIHPSTRLSVCLWLQGLTVRVEETKDRAF